MLKNSENVETKLWTGVHESIKTTESTLTNTFTAALSMNAASSWALPKLYRTRNRHCKAVHEMGRIPVEEEEFVITLTL